MLILCEEHCVHFLFATRHLFQIFSHTQTLSFIYFWQIYSHSQVNPLVILHIFTVAAVKILSFRGQFMPPMTGLVDSGQEHGVMEVANIVKLVTVVTNLNALELGVHHQSHQQKSPSKAGVVSIIMIFRQWMVTTQK